MSALKQLSDHDYDLEGEGCWIKAGNVTILLRKSETRLHAVFYRTGRESEGPIKTAVVSQFDRRDRE